MRLVHVPIRFAGINLCVTRFLIIAFFCSAAVLLSQEPSDATAGTAGLDLETLREFERLDRDRDHSLSEIEFSSGDLATRAREVGAAQAGELFRSIDLDHSATIELRELLRSQVHRNIRLIGPAGIRNYMSFDRNQDGLISEDEYLLRDKADPAVFRRIDLNGSGRVGPVEWLHALVREPERKAMMRRFIVLDADDSGALEPKECEALEGEFDTLDVNGNGLLSPGEFAKQTSGERADELDSEERELFGNLDRNGDQALSPREFANQERFQRGRFEEAMRQRLFLRLDANGDGEIDAREFSNRREAMRGGPSGGKGRGPKGGPGPAPRR